MSVGVLLSMSWWLVSTGAVAQTPPTVEVVVSPEAPAPADPIRLTVTGTWHNACVPQDPQTTIADQRILMTTTSDGPFCAQVITEFQFAVELGPLPSGTYEVEVIHQPADQEEKLIATHGFDVRSDDLPSQPCAYDANENGAIEDDELLRAIDDWVAGSIAEDVLFQLIDWWIVDAKACS